VVASSPSVLRARDGLELALSRRPVDHPHALCLVVHGYAEHAGRYDGLTRALADDGVETFAVDLRGHGRSAGTRADVRDFGDYVQDVLVLGEHARAQRPGLPVVVFGHSMGGTVALRLALEHGDALDALVLSAPFLRPSSPPPAWLLGLSSFLARAAPQLPVQSLDVRTLSRDVAEVESYREDPLNYNGRIKARMGHALVTAGAPLLARANALGVPTLIVHGAADRLADPHASEELAARMPREMVTLRLYPGAYHELLNDLDREAVLADIRDWLRERAGLQPSSTRNTRNLR